MTLLIAWMIIAGMDLHPGLYLVSTSVWALRTWVTTVRMERLARLP